MAWPNGQLAAHSPHCMQPKGDFPSPFPPSRSSNSAPFRACSVAIAALPRQSAKLFFRATSDLSASISTRRIHPCMHIDFAIRLESKFVRGTNCSTCSGAFLAIDVPYASFRLRLRRTSVTATSCGYATGFGNRGNRERLRNSVNGLRETDTLEGRAARKPAIAVITVRETIGSADV